MDEPRKIKKSLRRSRQRGGSAESPAATARPAGKSSTFDIHVALDPLASVLRGAVLKRDEQAEKFRRDSARAPKPSRAERAKARAAVKA
ncbi:MAG: hypothetical protein HXY25_06330, partial [Alphaproteobacteria bacterium]|nr:hypothetical protein [Alphaproteobacteria bacterium]